MAGLVDNIGKLLHWSFVEKFPPGSPEFGLLVTPLLVYWALAIFYDVLDRLNLPITRRFKVVRKVRGRENIPSKRQVVTRVLVQQLAQFVVAYVAMVLDSEQCAKRTAGNAAQMALQFLFGMLVMDTWQFWIHRTMHVYPVLYKNIHSHHHQLLIPYAWGALYNHPLEGLLLDTLGGLVTLYGGMMSCQAGAWLINFATAKTVLDHCGYVFPVNPLHGLFPNGAAYHDIHHDIKMSVTTKPSLNLFAVLPARRNVKKNYSQPFFTHWDLLMGSYKSPDDFHVPAGKEALAAANAQALAVAEAVKVKAKAAEATAAKAKAAALKAEDALSTSKEESRKDK